MSSEALIFDDTTAVQDLKSLINRAKNIQDDAASLVARGTALAVYVPVLTPDSLGSGQFTILGMRVHRLAEPAALTACYSLASIRDRLARMSDNSREFSLPPVEEYPSWAGIQVPVSGWKAVGEVQNSVLADAARVGITAVADALPENPGKPVIAQVRQRIWSSTQPDTEPALPLGAAFAMETLGFLDAGGVSAVYGQGTWLRVTSTRGHVLLRRDAALR